jgi:hypothetical protein
MTTFDLTLIVILGLGLAVGLWALAGITIEVARETKELDR